MLRFPNPGSTVQNFIAVFRAAHAQLRGQVVDLDDIVAAVVEANLATSSGHMGKQAIARSTRADRTRDPLYNQLKMYAELFRTLGWLHPTEQRSLNYTFTLLGDQLVAAGRHWLPLFRECNLGVVVPSRILEVKGTYDLRPFASILRLMRKLDDFMSRDEMIVGPLSATTDRTKKDLDSILALVAPMRRSAPAAKDALDAVAQGRGIQVNTLHNYTRWPIAVLRDSGWAVEARSPYQLRGTYKVYKLTPEGIATADALETASDIRLDQLESVTDEQRKAISMHAHYALLDRAGFDITTVKELLDACRPVMETGLAALGIPAGALLQVSPFQTLSVANINEIFSVTNATKQANPASAIPVADETIGRDSREHLFIAPRFIKRQADSDAEGSTSTTNVLNDCLRKYSTVDAAAAAFVDLHESDTKTDFYPLITDLFGVMGFRSQTSRVGVNYQRWDAAVWVNASAIPIEIKSPTEERELSNKAIRQALENKVISLSRGGIDAQRDVTSLIIGFALPAERAEMGNLIDDIEKAYGFRIGVIAIKSLVKLAMLSLTEDAAIEPDQLIRLKGFLDV